MKVWIARAYWPFAGNFVQLSYSFKAEPGISYSFKAEPGKHWNETSKLETTANEETVLIAIQVLSSDSDRS